MTDLLTKKENESIRAFMKQAASEGYFSGRVLDYGCGRQPYRSLVRGAGGIYFPFDRADFSANQFGDVGEADPLLKNWNTILCNQVIQYIPLYPDVDGLESLLIRFRQSLEDQGGHLVMTYPTNWPEVQDVDLHRFTKAGMERLLTEAGFEIVMHQRRATVHGSHNGEYLGCDFALGYGVVARA